MKNNFDVWVTLKEPFPTYEDLYHLRHELSRHGVDFPNIGVGVTQSQYASLARSIYTKFMVVKGTKIKDFMGFKIRIINEKEN